MAPLRNPRGLGLGRTEVSVRSGGKRAGPDLTELVDHGVEFGLDWESTREPKKDFHRMHDQTG